jgi:hypothetical protein
MNGELRKLRRRVEAVGPRHRGARIPSSLRAAIAAYAGDERAAGASCRGIAERLGVSAESIRRWTVRTPVRDGGSELVPVRVVAEAAAGRLTIWSPAGYRVDGLSIHAAAELLRSLA